MNIVIGICTANEILFHVIFTGFPKSSGLTCSQCLWNVLTVSAGAMDCTEYAMGISKIINSVILPLANIGVSLFCMSTYQGDFILVTKCTLYLSMGMTWGEGTGAIYPGPLAILFLGQNCSEIFLGKYQGQILPQALKCPSALSLSK